MPIDRISGYPQVLGCLCLGQTLIHTGHDALTECLNLRDNLVGAHQSCIRRWSDFVVVIRAFLVAFGLCVEARQKNFTKIMAVIE